MPKGYRLENFRACCWRAVGPDGEPFAEGNDPEIAVVTLIEHGGAGGEHAAPIGIEIARRYFEEIAPRQEAPLIAERPTTKKKRTAITVDSSETTAASTHRR